jgi:hypothetical protein
MNDDRASNNLYVNGDLKVRVVNRIQVYLTKKLGVSGEGEPCPDPEYSRQVYLYRLILQVSTGS